VVLAVSTDPLEAHQEFEEQGLERMVPGGARFPLVSDPRGEIGSLYGVYDAARKMEMRSRFILDPEGIVQSVEMVAAPMGRSVAEILRQLRALKEHRATGRMTPCGWEPGKPTWPRRTNRAGREALGGVEAPGGAEPGVLSSGTRQSRL
jgi:peroxiredoxin (alkyl hydroperoxide reductase subunit C)